MRVTQIVRIGGKLALLAGCAVFSLASANSLTYFYGYSSPSLTGWQTQDAFASQNVQFVPEVSMVSNAGMFTPWNYTAYGSGSASSANSSGWAPISSTSDSYGGWSSSSSSFGSTSSNFGSSSGTSWSSVSTGSYGSDTSGYSGGFGSYPAMSYGNGGGFSSWFTSPGMSAPPPVQTVAWQPIRDSAVTPVTSNFDTPTVLPEILPPAINNPFPQDLHSPEPSTIGLMAAGMLGVLYLRKRRA